MAPGAGRHHQEIRRDRHSENAWATPGRWVGNGPFDLASWRHGQEIVVTRSPTYWDEARVRLREIHFHAFDSIDAEERAFRTEQLHVTETIPPDKVDTYRAKDSRAALRIDPLLGTYFLRVNIRRPGLDDARVRLALSLAIDRAAIVEKVLRGGQSPALTFTPPGLAGLLPGAGAQRMTPREGAAAPLGCGLSRGGGPSCLRAPL